MRPFLLLFLPAPLRLLLTDITICLPLLSLLLWRYL